MCDRDHPTVSVCLASYNGEKYIALQVQSILSSELVTQLIVSDDGSSDETVNILSKIDDKRMITVDGPQRGVAKNFEHAMSYANGSVIFLSDQDDIWLPEKVSEMCAALSDADLVISDCMVVDQDLRVQCESFYRLNNSGPGALKNLVRCGYLGCCMAFRREVLEWALPIPSKIPMHDWWFGLVAGAFGRVKFMDERLILYRRHGENITSTAGDSPNSYTKRIWWRLVLIFEISLRGIRIGYRKLRVGTSRSL